MDAIGVIKHLKWVQLTHKILKSTRFISERFLLIQNCKILGFITFSLRPLPGKSETKGNRMILLLSASEIQT